MEKSLIVVPATGDWEHYKYCLPTVERFAARFGCDLHIESGPGLPWPHGTWLKMDLIDKVDGYDRVVVMDADLYLTDNITDEDANKLLHNTIPALAPDMGRAKIKPRILSWAKRNYDVTIEQVDQHYYNAGLMSWPKAYAKQLKEYFLRFNYRTNEYFHEQDFINMFIIDQKIPIQILDRELNYMGLADLTVRTDLKIIHFVGGHKKLIPAYELWQSQHSNI